MSDRTIDPTWTRTIIQAINSHFLNKISEGLGVFLILPDQDDPDYTKLPEWVEISLFGPIYDFPGVRAINAMIQVQLRVFFKKADNIYRTADLTGQLAHAATLPIKIASFGKCLDNQGVRTLPKGRISHKHAAVAAEVTVTYELKIKE